MATMPVLVKTITRLMKGKDHLKLAPWRWELFYAQLNSYYQANKTPIPKISEGVVTVAGKQLVRSNSSTDISKTNVVWAKRIDEVRTAEKIATAKREGISYGVREERQEAEGEIRIG